MKFFASKAIMALGTAFIAASHVTAQACQAQGTGNCQLYFEADHTLPPGVDGWDKVIWEQVTIYNWRCDVIGGRDRPYSGLAVYSQLPYTVVIDSIGRSFDMSYFEFRYAAYSFKGSFWCSATQAPFRDGVGHETIRCIHAFPC